MMHGEGKQRSLFSEHTTISLKKLRLWINYDEIVGKQSKKYSMKM